MKIHGPNGDYVSQPLEVRFWEKVNIKSKDKCWEWKGYTGGRGYGRIRDGDKMRTATSVSWFLHHGKWPQLCMCHVCDNPSCVNPNHLFEGSHLDNGRDKAKKGRAPKGSLNKSAKTNEETVLKLKKDLKKMKPKSVAEKYGINYWTVIKIKNHKQWKHV